MYENYRAYIGARGRTKFEQSVSDARDDLISHSQDNPDFQPNVLRNGVLQPMILTRGGEKFTYNIICLPGDDLYGGDIIDAFGEKWIVMEARADATTHKTGIMHQCNHLFRFQNFSSKIIERWGYIDQSGYSSSVTGTNQMQKAEEQFALYLPYDEETAKIFVDKRLASHIGYDQFGNKILVAFKITSCSPNTFSFNAQDHLLGLKAIRDVYSEATDNLEELICDYISPSDEDPPIVPTPPSQEAYCEIHGAANLLLGRTRVYTGKFIDEAGDDVSALVSAVWAVPVIDGITFKQNGNTLKVSAAVLDSLIGASFEVRLTDTSGTYKEAIQIVEVGNIA